MTQFRFDVEDELFPKENVERLEWAFSDVVEADCPLCFEFVFVDEDEIRRLNRETRGIDKVTDVLSYPSLDGIKGKALLAKDYPLELDEDGALFIGSVAVCHARAKEQAEEYGHSLNRELHYLLTHGVLHCLGYDHMSDEDKSEMREREEYVLKKLGIER
ncbi:MAG: rRNA maturation RNase YbeY [Clostridiales bacterium]|nr:rRNA maturation RNase YbeY [Clostridiales bacterium]